MPYVDVQTIHNPATGLVAPAAWGDGVRDNLEFLIAPPLCSAFGTAPQSIPNDTATAMAAGGENFDTDAMHSTVTNNSRVTFQTAGRYEVGVAVLWASNATGRRAVDLRVNGTTTYNLDGRMTVTTGNSMAVTGSRLLTVAAGDYVECMTLQSSGGSLNCTLNEISVAFRGR